MPRIDVECASCGVISEVFRHHRDHPNTPTCPKCDGPTEQVLLPPRTVISSPAVVVYKAPDGSFRYPGSDDPHCRTAKQYESLGYERVERRGWAEVRRLEKDLNAFEGSKVRESVERQCARREAMTHNRRSDVYNGLANSFTIPELDRDGRRTGRIKAVKLSEHGKDLVRAAIAQNDRKPGPSGSSAGMFVEAFQMDRSNRDESRRGDGHRHRD